MYYAPWQADSYGQPTAISELNTPYRDADPELSTDGKLLFFTSTKPGGLGHFDLQVAVKQANGKWGAPINLGRQINSPGMDSDPILSADGNTLFFSSEKLNRQHVLQLNPVTDYPSLTQRFDLIENGLMNIYQVDITELNAYLKATSS